MKKVALVAPLVIALGLITWFAVEANSWENRCRSAGGVVESRFIGYITINVQVGSVTVPQLVPNYSYHCMIDGEEVAV